MRESFGLTHALAFFVIYFCSVLAGASTPSCCSTCEVLVTNFQLPFLNALITHPSRIEQYVKTNIPEAIIIMFTTWQLLPVRSTARVNDYHRRQQAWQRVLNGDNMKNASIHAPCLRVDTLRKTNGSRR